MRLSENETTILGIVLTILGVILLFWLAKGVLSFLLDHWLLSSTMAAVAAGAILYYIFVQTETLKR
jgi:uncharacterized protein YjeT (DUF2065 family)